MTLSETAACRCFQPLFNKIVHPNRDHSIDLYYKGYYRLLAGDWYFCQALPCHDLQRFDTVLNNFVFYTVVVNIVHRASN